MSNFATNPAGTASASLVIDAKRQQQAVQSTSAPQAVQSPQATTLSTGEQVQLENYTVKKGDTLWDIAGVKMGNPNNWPALFSLNKAQISNPNLIHPGQVLMVPQKIQVAPTVPQQPMPSPEPVAPPSPAPVTPTAPAAVTEEVITPSQPAPSAPAAPAQEEVITPTAPAAPAPAQEEAKPTPVAAEPAPTAGPISQADLEWALQLQNKIEKENYQPNADEIARYKDLLAKAQAAEQEAAATQPAATTKPAEPGPIVLRPPDQLPAPAEETPVAVTPTPAQPTQPVAPQPEAPKPPAIVGTTPIAENKKSALGKVALISGSVGATTTGAVLIGLTAKIGSNLGGYATAQVVAKGINSVTSKVGLKLPTGPALSKLVSKVGGPKVAGTVAAVGTGLVVAGLAAGSYYLYKKATDKGEPAQPANAPPLPATAPAVTQQASATPAPTAPAANTPAPISQEDLDWAVDIQAKVEKEQYQPKPEEVARYQDLVSRAEAAEKQATATPAGAPAPAANAEGPLGNIQPVVDPKSRPPVDVSPLHAKLGELLSQKQYVYFGSSTQPEKVREVGVQIWLDGKVDDRVKLANTLVSNGQAELLGRVMSHQETTPEEIGEVMSHPQFPVGAYMKALNDGDAFQVLNSLSGLALKGNTAAAQTISQTVAAYDGWRDREAPFNRLKQHQVAQGTWQQMPAELRGKIEELLK